MNTLICFNEISCKPLCFRFLNMTVDKSSGLRISESASIISDVDKYIAFDFIRQNWDAVYAR